MGGASKTFDDADLRDAGERPGSGAFFDRIAGRYDLVNRLMTFGLDQRWRRAAIRSLGLEPGARVLDVATGTADVAIEAARTVEDCRVVGVDPSASMLEIGRRKVADAGLVGRIELRPGRAESLLVDDLLDADGALAGGFDGVTIAWGIRNVADRPAALAEMARTLRPGGRIAVLESLDARGTLLAPFVRFYARHVVPRLGALLSREDEYRYLQSSIHEFPPAEEFEEMMRRAGFHEVASRPLLFGACRLFTGRKPADPASGEETS